METLKFHEESAIRDNCAIETRVFVPFGNVQCQLLEGFRTEAERVQENQISAPATPLSKQLLAAETLQVLRQ